MDKEFMESYYDMRYESLMMVSEEWNDPAYQKACEELREAENALAELIGSVGTDGWRMYERCINTYSEVNGFHFKAIYLAGAEDREKMLR